MPDLVAARQGGNGSLVQQKPALLRSVFPGFEIPPPHTQAVRVPKELLLVQQVVVVWQELIEVAGTVWHSSAVDQAWRHHRSVNRQLASGGVTTDSAIALKRALKQSQGSLEVGAGAQVQ